MAILIRQVKRRLHWEFLVELGLRSQVGRSLERTGVAMLSWDPNFIKTASLALLDNCQNLLGQTLSIEQAEQVLWGITIRLKRKGAIYDPMLQGFAEAGGDWYLISRNHLRYMPNLGSHSLLPKFPAEDKEKGLEQLIPKTGDNWYTRWLTLALDAGALYSPDFVAELLKLSFSCLVDQGLVVSVLSKKDNRIWGLDASKLVVTTRLDYVNLYRTVNGDGGEQRFGNWPLPEEWLDAIQGLPSLENLATSSSGPARYAQNYHPRVSTYKRFYLEGEVRRVIGHEHTALLAREEREELEQRFMAPAAKRNDWYENLLSATPTLEMGIDIGDLSSVMMCSVPPSQASYLQRAGRGGRRDGNSFVMTVANGTPHDLFFYADPLKLIAEDVDAPGIYLNASMVLKRQLLAFCFDRWGMAEAGKQVIPKTMQPVLDAVENQNQTRFPYTLLQFISVNRDDLWDGFVGLLGNKVTDFTKETLRDYFLVTGPIGEALPLYVLGQLQRVVKERNALGRDQKDIGTELRKVLRKPKDQSRDELEAELQRELDGIKRLKTMLNRKETLNFFTDEGLLPNYAFPEEGTTLRSVIYRKLKNPETGPDGRTVTYKTETFEYTRPAHSAISELAPESIFYASNRKVEVERIEMANGSNLEWWRLCPNCSFTDLDTGAALSPACPRCQDRMWADSGQLKPMVRLTQVYANTREDLAQIGDDNETREPTFFNRQMLIDFNPDDTVYAYANANATNVFGFEFIKKVQFKEINFGEQGSDETKFSVAGVELARPGFKICRECGTVQRRGKDGHTYRCSYREVAEDADDGIVECLYLYRHYESEAIRILMPRLSVVNREEQLQSFVAALQLGLKTRFKGKVDHLHITFHDEPVPGSTDRRSYLVLFDTVPGGTGYLQELLSDPAHMIDMLNASLNVLNACSCQHQAELDGCYNCLYAYRNSYGMEQTSRKTAIEMLTEVISDAKDLEKVPGLGSVVQNPWADSELEARFPEAIQNLATHDNFKDDNIRITRDIVNGKVGFKLEVNGRLYTVEPHRKLDTTDGVLYPCEPDFFITLDKAGSNVPPLAVFLDGYRYHKDIVTEDLLKRQGIFRATNMLTWSLTWYDLNHAFAANETRIPNVFTEKTENSPLPFIGKLAVKKHLQDHQKYVEHRPLSMLMKFLINPDVDIWRGVAGLRSFCWLNKDTMATDLPEFDRASQGWPSSFSDQFSGLELKFASHQKHENLDASLALNIAGGEQAISAFNHSELLLAAIYDVEDADTDNARLIWQRLLQVINLGQFLPHFFVGTKKGINEGSFTNLNWGQTATPQNDEWDALRVLVDRDAIQFLEIVMPLGIAKPTIGFELSDARGATIAEAELAWPEKRVAFVLPHQLTDSEAPFKSQKWHLLTIESTEQDVINHLGGDE